MNYRYPLILTTVLVTTLACGLPGPKPAPTVIPLPVTPMPLLVPTSAPAQGTFSGTWWGPDPDDGSVMTLTLVASDSSLTGTYRDSFSGGIAPPGFEGTASGEVLSPTTAQMKLDARRHDGAAVSLQANLTLSSQGNALTVTFPASSPSTWMLGRK